MFCLNSKAQDQDRAFFFYTQVQAEGLKGMSNHTINKMKLKDHSLNINIPPHTLKYKSAKTVKSYHRCLGSGKRQTSSLRLYNADFLNKVQ